MSYVVRVTDFKVRFSDVRAAGDSFADLHEIAEDQLTSLASVQLTQADFGRVPWLQSRIFEAFQEHTTECTDALEELSGVLESTSEGLHLTADSYEEIEAAIVEAINKFFQEA